MSAELEAKQISMDEVKKHNSQGDCWMVIHGRVFDPTKFLSEHPGGPEVMLQLAGAFH